MSDNTKIEWTDATFNPWMGCTKVSPGCDNCYAERLGRRFGVVWGAAPRREFSDKHWDQPRAWNRRAAHSGRSIRVFCASMADVFDNDVPQTWRDRLWQLIRETPHLTWLVLTKRIGNAERMLPADWGRGYPNVVLMVTVVNQTEADRDIVKLLRLYAHRRGVSIEPMLGPIDLCRANGASVDYGTSMAYVDALRGDVVQVRKDWPDEREHWGRGLDWVICGGESGTRARPMHPDWARSLRDQCAAAGVPFFFKQWGEWLPAGQQASNPPPLMTRDDTEQQAATGKFSVADGQAYWRLGKKAAGRLLDGVEHNAYPSTAQR